MEFSIDHGTILKWKEGNTSTVKEWNCHTIKKNKGNRLNTENKYLGEVEIDGANDWIMKEKLWKEYLGRARGILKS